MRAHTARDTKLFWLVLALGAVIRLIQIPNRSLWLDEIFLAFNLVDRNFLGFFKPLNYHQIALPGYLVLAKLTITLLGTADWVFRSFAAFFGVTALFFLGRIAKKLLGLKWAIAAVALAAANPILIVYATEAKPYPVDFFISCLIFLYGLKAAESKIDLKFTLVFFFCAVTSVSAQFTLASVVLGLGICFLRQKRWSDLLRLLLISFLYAGLMGTLYFVLLKSGMNDRYLVSGWHMNKFSPLGLFKLAEQKELLIKFVKELTKLLALKKLWFVFIFLALGMFRVLRNRDSRWIMLVLPIFGAYLGQEFHILPIEFKLMMELVPCLILLILLGLKETVTQLRKWIPFAIVFWVAPIVFSVYLFSMLGVGGKTYVRQGDSGIFALPRENLKPAVSYLQSKVEVGDTLYLYYMTQPAFKWYSKRFGFPYTSFSPPIWTQTESAGAVITTSDAPRIINGKSSWYGNWKNYMKDFDQFRGNPRVWLLFSFIWDSTNHEVKHTISYLEKKGKIIDSYQSRHVSLYLMDFSSPYLPSRGSPIKKNQGANQPIIP